MTTETIGGRLRLARERKGLSARALSKKAELSPGYVALVESGERPSPSADAVTKLADALEVSLEWLIRGDEPSRHRLADDCEATGEHGALKSGNGTEG